MNDKYIKCIIQHPSAVLVLMHSNAVIIDNQYWTSSICIQNNDLTVSHAVLPVQRFPHISLQQQHPFENKEQNLKFNFKKTCIYSGNFSGFRYATHGIFKLGFNAQMRVLMSMPSPNPI